MHLTRSAATAYLEQNILFKELSDRDLEKLFYLRGMNLENIITLMKLGYLNKDVLDRIKEPDYGYIRQEWEKRRAQYEISQSDRKV